MKYDDTPGLKNPDRRHESTDNEGFCPTCGDAIAALTTQGPSTHHIQPCGHRVGPLTARELVEEKPLRADGGVSVADLTAFQHNILVILAEESRYGLAIKRDLEEYYGEEVNHGRLYPNLNRLIEMEFVQKKALDKRTNLYELTDAAIHALRARRDWVDERLDASVIKQLDEARSERAASTESY